MDIRIFSNSNQATCAAADCLEKAFMSGGIRNVMVAGGHTPLALYAELARRELSLSHLNIFALDDYVGVGRNEPRNCANLILREVVQPWGVPAEQYFHLSSIEDEAEATIIEHERTIRRLGGLDLVILGLGQNGHIGFNEPGSEATSTGRLLSLDSISVEANRQWFNGALAPDKGVTTGMQTILAARSVLLLAFGPHKANAVAAMCEGPMTSKCPASFLQKHPHACCFIDRQAAADLQNVL
jgi:glucosamine-6-phosphate deaminase